MFVGLYQLVYTGGVPQRLDTDVHSAVTATTTTTTFILNAIHLQEAVLRNIIQE